MARKRSQGSAKPRGAQKWVLDELRGLKSGIRLSTADIATRIAKASGKTFHKNSVYNALRALVRRGTIAVERQGHEKLYSTTGAEPTPPTAVPAGRRAKSKSQPVVAEPGPAHTGAQFPHKLALGEVLVLSFGDGELVTATNVYGKVVIERHPIPD